MINVYINVEILIHGGNMRIKTTLHLRRETETRISDAAAITGLNKSEIVVKIMRKLMRNEQAMMRLGNAVHYQAKAPGEEWCRMHLGLWAGEYESFIDTRKLFKWSVSFLVALAVEKYLDKVLEDLNGADTSRCSDNYLYLHYAIVHKQMDDVVCWKLFRGMPRKKRKLFL